MIDSIRPQMKPGLQELAAARAGNQHGDDLVALTTVHEAQQSFLRSGMLPGEVGARFVEIVTVLGLLRHDECLAKAESLIPDLGADSYPWLKGQLQIYAAVCLMRLGQLGEATTHLNRAMEISDAAGLLHSNLNQAEFLVGITF